MKVRTPLAAVIVVLGMGAVGCSFSVGSSVSQAEVEAKIGEGIEQQVGEAMASVSCPGSLKGEVDTEMACTAASQAGSEYSVAVKVTSVEGSTVNFNWEIDSITKVGADDIAQALQGQLEVVPIEDIVCDGEVQAQVGQVQRCSFVDTDGSIVEVDAEIASIDGAIANFGFSVAE